MRVLLELSGVRVVRDGTILLDSISVNAAAGEFIGLVGPNGAGKSTLLRAAACVEPIDSGNIRINGAGARSLTPISRARLLSFLPQERDVHWAVTAEAVVALGRFPYGQPGKLDAADLAAVDRALAEMDAKGFRHRVMQSLSGGEQTRIHLARVFATGALIVLCDEPTAALDPKHALSVLDALRKKADDGALVIAALHDLDLAARYCSRIVVLDHGRIIADGPPADALSDDVIAAAFDVRAERIGADRTLRLSLNR